MKLFCLHHDLVEVFRSFFHSVLIVLLILSQRVEEHFLRLRNRINLLLSSVCALPALTLFKSISLDVLHQDGYRVSPFFSFLSLAFLLLDRLLPDLFDPGPQLGHDEFHSSVLSAAYTHDFGQVLLLVAPPLKFVLLH